LHERSCLRQSAGARSCAGATRHAGAVWIWPGIALTEKLGTAIVPVGAEVARFWITRLHGPEANDSLVLKCIEAAAQKLNEGDEASAQRALNGAG